LVWPTTPANRRDAHMLALLYWLLFGPRGPKMRRANEDVLVLAAENEPRMLRLLRWLLFGPPRRKTCMTKDDVMTLAAKAANAARIQRRIGLVTVRQVEGRLTWIASTATKGSGWSVCIDDATGKVGPVERWGIR
jgi:hypothetical protein